MADDEAYVQEMEDLGVEECDDDGAGLDESNLDDFDDENIEQLPKEGMAARRSQLRSNAGGGGRPPSARPASAGVPGARDVHEAWESAGGQQNGDQADAVGLEPPRTPEMLNQPVDEQRAAATPLSDIKQASIGATNAQTVGGRGRPLSARPAGSASTLSGMAGPGMGGRSPAAAAQRRPYSAHPRSNTSTTPAYAHVHENWGENSQQQAGDSIPASTASCFGSFPGRKLVRRPLSASMASRGAVPGTVAEATGSSWLGGSRSARASASMTKSMRNNLRATLKEEMSLLSAASDMAKSRLSSANHTGAMHPRIRPKSAGYPSSGLKKSAGSSKGTPTKSSPALPAMGELEQGEPAGLEQLDTLLEEHVDPVVPMFQCPENLAVDGDVALRILREKPQGMFLDKVFPAGEESIGSGTQLVDPSTVVWRRPQQIAEIPVLFGHGRASMTVRQGCLGNCWFLGALATIASRGDLVQQLFSRFSKREKIEESILLSKGVFTVQFYKDCAWHPVTVDTLLPTDSDGLVFASAADTSTFWASIIEKAYAKLHGSYSALQGGSVGEAMVDLTGGVSFRMELNGIVNSRSSIDSAWKAIVRAHRGGNLMGSSIVVKGIEGLAECGEGILINHTYAIVDVRLVNEGLRFVRLYNPWGECDWRGPWSEGSGEWEANPSISQKLRMAEASHSMETAGYFWMVFEDFLRLFSRVHICRLIPHSWESTALRAEWTENTSGGPPDQATWPLNPQFRMWGRQAGEVVIALSQKDRRGIRDSGAKPSLIGFTVWRCKRGALPQRVWWPDQWRSGHIRAKAGASNALPEMVVEAQVSDAREVSASLWIEAGVVYYIVPHTLNPGTTGAFTLRSYCASSFEIVRVPPAFQSSVDDVWDTQHAGGRRGDTSFFANPQYSLQAVAGDATVLLLLRRFPMAGGNEPLGGGGCGVVVVDNLANHNGNEGSGGTISGNVQERSVVVESDYLLPAEAVVMFRMRQGQSLHAIPALSSAGVQGRFQLTLLADKAIRVMRVPSTRANQLDGAWDSATNSCGGSHMNSSFLANPQIHLQIPGPVVPGARAHITLHRRGTAWPRKCKASPVGTMIGAYVFKGKSRLFRWPKGDTVHEAVFTPSESAQITVKVPQRGIDLIIVPATYDKGVNGGFSVDVRCNAEFKLSEASRS